MFDLFKKRNIEHPNEAQLQAWKAKHQVYTLEAQGKQCYLRKPSRKELLRAAKKKDAVAFVRLLFEACWLGGDPSLKEKFEEVPDEYSENVAAGQVTEQWSLLLNQIVDQTF